MASLFRFLSLCVTVLLLGGCASAPEIAPADAVQRFKRVAVVSTVGATFTRTYVGATVFGNEKHVRPVPEWQLDKTYERQIAAELTRRGYSVVEAAYPTAEFAKGNAGRYAPDWDGLLPIVKAQCVAHGLDAFFVVAHWNEGGIRVHAQRAPGAPWSAGIFLASALGLYDCASGKLIASRRVANPALKPKNPLGDRPMPGRALPEGWPWYGAWSPEVLDQAKAVFVQLPQPIWAPLLADMLPVASR